MVSGAAGDAGLCAEEVDKYSEPFTQPDSGSEHRSNSPRSFDRGSDLRKHLQGRPSHSTHSSSHSRSSDRSRGSVVMSHRAASASADKSRPHRETGKMVGAAQSGSDGSDKGHIWSVGSVGGLSDNESF